jgi:anti-sigma B factor antagonist
MDEISVTRQDRDGAVRLTVAGPVLMTTAGRLRDELDQVLREHAATRVDVDLAGVWLLDSSGVSVLIGCLTAAHNAGRDFAVSNPTAHVYRTLQILGLLDILHVTDTSHDRR